MARGVTAEIERDRGAAAEIASDGDEAAAPLDEALQRRETEARPATGGLRREASVEHPRLRFRRHADSRIGDDERDVRASHVAIHAIGRGAWVDVERLDRDRPAVGHCVSRVRAEVQERLLDLVLLDPDRANLRIERERQLDPVAEQGREERSHVGDHGIHVDRRRGRRVVADDREHALQELGGAITHAPEIQGELPGARLRIELSDEEPGDREHGSEEIVEIVDDAGGQISERVDPARVPKLGRALTELGHVAEDQDVPIGRVRLRLDRHVADGAAFAPEAELYRRAPRPEELLAKRRELDPAERPTALRACDEVAERDLRLEELVRSAVFHHHAPEVVDHDGRERRVLEYERIEALSLLALVEPSLELLDVVRLARHGCTVRRAPATRYRWTPICRVGRGALRGVGVRPTETS